MKDPPGRPKHGTSQKYIYTNCIRQTNPTHFPIKSQSLYCDRDETSSSCDRTHQTSTKIRSTWQQKLARHRQIALVQTKNTRPKSLKPHTILPNKTSLKHCPKNNTLSKKPNGVLKYMKTPPSYSIMPTTPWKYPSKPIRVQPKHYKNCNDHIHDKYYTILCNPPLPNNNPQYHKSFRHTQKISTHHRHHSEPFNTLLLTPNYPSQLDNRKNFTIPTKKHKLNVSLALCTFIA